MKYLISFIIGFCFGVIPFSYLIARIKGIDLIKIGSGNIGATNLSRALGLPFFLIGFILDGLKGLIPVLLVKTFFLFAPIAGIGAILGHVFNPFFKFRGGKGVSTTIGVAIGLTPLSFMVGLVIWLIVYLSTYLVSLASISFALVLPITAFIMHEASVLDRIFITIIALLVIYAHHPNIRRLFNNLEPKTILWKKR